MESRAGIFACVAGAALAAAFAAESQSDEQTFIKEAVQALQVEPPTQSTTEAGGFYKGLSQLSRSQFDAAFVSHMVVTHEAAIAKYSRDASSNNAALASLVAETLPKLKAHLEAAQALQRGAPAHARH